MGQMVMKLLKSWRQQECLYLIDQLQVLGLKENDN